MKRKILFVIESLACSGAEKSLVSLLNQINYNDYEVDLQLFSYGHPFEKHLPKEVNLLPQLPFFRACQKSLIKLFFQNDFRFLFDRILYSIQLRINKKGVTESACIMWQCTNTSFNKSNIKYDVAVAYAQGVPTFYVADKIIATKKIGWINAIYLPTGYYFGYINSFYNNFHHIVCVSDTIEKKVIEIFQIQAKKTVIIRDILSEKIVTEQSNEIADNHLKKDENEFSIVTIGNLKITKGYDLVLKAALILKHKGINFNWYVLGKGPYKDEMINFLSKHKLANNVFLLGIKDNPYPYIKKSDVLVHASRFEGYGMVLAEAKILNKPIVSTNFEAVYAQITHKKNGMIVEMNENAIVEGLLELMQDKNLYDSIVANLKRGKKGNEEEILNFYNLISS